MNLRIGVVGTGGISQFHIDRIERGLGNGRVVGIAGSNPARAARVVEHYPEIKVHVSPDDLIRDPDVDAIIVASAGHAHARQVLAVIAQGKPVFCEKPLATTAEECLRIVDAEVRLGRRLVQVGFMRRFDPSYVALKKAVAAGTIGAPLLFHSVHRNPKTGERFDRRMIFDDAAVHDVDIARWLLEDEVSHVSVMRPRANRNAQKDAIDPVLILLEMASGTVVDVELSANIAYGYDIRAEISGETGVLSLAETSMLVTRTSGTFRGDVSRGWRERFEAAFDHELREWMLAAARGTATGPSAWDGYAATLVATTALRAVEEGRLEVGLAPRPALYD